MANLATTKELRKLRVIGGKNGRKRIGKVRDCVFHPSERRCIGLTVRRPDFLWMFHRADWFIPLGGFDLVDGRIVIKPGVQTNGAAACRKMGIDWDSCIIWDGMPLMTDDEQFLGRVGYINLDLDTGQIESVQASNGYTAQYFLGELNVPARMIRGFKKGIGDALSIKQDSRDLGEEYQFRGAIMVSDEVWELEPEGGWAAAAGEMTAKAKAKAKEIGAKAEEKVDAAAHVASESVQQGAYLTGKQIASTQGMFSSFKEEYQAARDGEETEVGAQVAQESSQKGMFAAFKEEYRKAVEGDAEEDSEDTDEYEAYEDDEAYEYEDADDEYEDEYEDDDEDEDAPHKSASRKDEDEDEDAPRKYASRKDEDEDMSDMLKRAVSAERIGGMFSSFTEEYRKARDGK